MNLELLIEQLKIDGKMLIPIEDSSGAQHLTLLTKGSDQEIKQQKILPVRFVPLVNGR